MPPAQQLIFLGKIPTTLLLPLIYMAIDAAARQAMIKMHGIKRARCRWSWSWLSSRMSILSKLLTM